MHRGALPLAVAAACLVVAVDRAAILAVLAQVGHHLTGPGAIGDPVAEAPAQSRRHHRTEGRAHQRITFLIDLGGEAAHVVHRQMQHILHARLHSGQQGSWCVPAAVVVLHHQRSVRRVRYTEAPVRRFQRPDRVGRGVGQLEAQMHALAAREAVGGAVEVGGIARARLAGALDDVVAADGIGRRLVGGIAAPGPGTGILGVEVVAEAGGIEGDRAGQAVLVVVAEERGLLARVQLADEIARRVIALVPRAHIGIDQACLAPRRVVEQPFCKTRVLYPSPIIHL